MEEPKPNNENHCPKCASIESKMESMGCEMHYLLEDVLEIIQDMKNRRLTIGVGLLSAELLIKQHRELWQKWVKA